jgi:hypothetical protein
MLKGLTGFTRLAMRGKDFNCGLRGGLFEARHFNRMGAAVWLYGWLILRQTRQSGDVGWVLGGAPVTYREIEDETGFNRRTLERWMRTLRSQDYIATQTVPGGISIRILKAKKFSRPGRNVPGGVRDLAEGVRRLAQGATQTCGAIQPQLAGNSRVTAEIGSSCVARLKDTPNPALPSGDFHRICPNFPQSTADVPSGLPQPNPSSWDEMQNRKHKTNKPAGLQQPFDFIQEARLRLQLWKLEREEAVRRELAVGTGPEVHRS